MNQIQKRWMQQILVKQMNSFYVMCSALQNVFMTVRLLSLVYFSCLCCVHSYECLLTHVHLCVQFCIWAFLLTWGSLTYETLYPFSSCTAVCSQLGFSTGIILPMSFITAKLLHINVILTIPQTNKTRQGKIDNKIFENITVQRIH